MRKLLVLATVVVAMFGSSLTASSAAAASAAADAKARSRLQTSPRYFEANRGQWPANQAYRAYGYGYGIALGGDEVTLQLAKPQGNQPHDAKSAKPAAPSAPSSILPREVSLHFEGASPAAKFTGEGELAAKGAWFAGEEANWHSDIPLYDRVRLGQVYPGIDATFYGHDGQLEYDLDVAPGARADTLVLDLDGADHAAIATNGDLTIEANGQRIVLHKPLAWQESKNDKQAVEVSYALLPAAAGHSRRIGLKLGSYDTSKALTIDPVLTFATYLSSATNALADGYLVDLTVDSANNVYVLSTDTQYSSMTVQKLSPSAALLYTATFASTGSSNNLYPLMIRVNASGQAYIAVSDRGYFPTTTTGYQPKYPNGSYGGAFNAALSVLSADGSKLTYSTYFGGTANGSYGPDYAFALAVDATGNAYLAGWANGGNFPVTAGALQTQYTSGNQSGFVAKFNPVASGAASLVYSTLLGGQYTYLNGIAVDALGNAYVAAGNSSCAYLPNTPGAFAYSGINTASQCGYITELNPTGTATVYSAYLGPGTPTAIAVDASQDAYITGGYIQADDFPTTSGAYQVSSPDGFVAELNPTGGLVYSTFLSGPSGTAGAGKVGPSSIALLPGCVSACSAYVSGQTFAADFPVINGLSTAPPTVGQGNDFAGFLAVINGTGSAAITSGYLNGLASFQEVYQNGTGCGGQGSCSGYTPHVAVDSLGNAWLGGSLYQYSGTPDFPVTTSALPGTNGSWLAEVSLANSGTVIAVPNTISFGTNVPVNVNSATYSGTPTTISLRNLGSAPVTFSSVIASPSVFAESDNCNGTIPAAGNCTAQVSFTPGTDAAVNGTLTITSNGVNSPLTIPLTGQGSDTGYIQVSQASLNFGNQTVGTTSAPQTVTFTNVGDEPFGYMNYEVVSPGYTLVGNCPTSLPPGNSCQMQVTFAPGVNQVGLAAGVLQNDYNAIQQVALSGIGVLPTGSGGSQILSFSGSTLNFGTETVGAASPAQSIYMTNVGTQPVNILVPTLTLTSSQGSTSDFQVSTFGSINMLPTAYTNFSVTFTPSTTAMETATLSIPIAGSSTIYTVNLIGQGAASTQTLELEPGNMVFPDQVVDTPAAAQTFYLENAGSSPLLISRVIASGDFAISSNGCAGFTIAPAPAPGDVVTGQVSNESCYISVVFTPTQIGSRTGTISIYNSSSSTPQTFALTGNGIVATGSLAVAPLLLPFGTQIKGTTSTQQPVSMVNQGNTSVTLTSLTTTGDYAINQAATSCGVLPFVMGPGSSCYTEVTFTPTIATGADNGTLVINSSAGAQTVTLTGTGEAATLSASVWPTTVNLGSIATQASSGYVPVYVVNTGTDPLKITAASTITGNFATGGQDYCANTTLAAGQDCVVMVNFTPTAPGARTGTLTVKTAAGNLAVALTGTGTSASLGTPTYFSPAMGTSDQQAVNTVSAPQTIYFTYTGTNPSFALNGASITAGSANFQLTTGINAVNTCSANLGSTTTCQVNISYAPTAPGLQTGVLTINSSIGAFTLPLTGYSPAVSDTGYLTPGSLNFGSQVVTTTSSFVSVILTNTGAAAFTIGSVGGTNFGPTAEFQVYAGGAYDTCSNATLATPDAQNGTPGSCYIYVQFAPSAAGARTGVLSIPVTYADGTTGSFTASLTGTGIAQKNEAILSPTIASFPDLPVGQTGSTNYNFLTLTNSGNLPFNVGQLIGSNVIIGTTKTGDFAATASDGCSNQQVAPGSGCSVYTVFQPIATGARTGTLTFPVTYANSTTATPIVATLSGKAFPAAPSIVLSPSVVQFGAATAGTTGNNEQTISVNNTGNVPVTIAKTSLSTGFTYNYDGCTGTTINPGSGGCVVDVSFSPTTASAGTVVSGLLVVTDTSTGSTHSAALSGISLANTSELGFSQTTLTFGNQQVATASTTATLYLTNQGSKPDKIYTIALSGANKADFTESDTCAGVTLAAYTSCSISLTFTPGAAGARTATITESDSGSGGPRSVTLTGTGTVAGANVVLFPAALTFSAQQNTGEGSAQQFFSVTSTGVNPVTITAIASTDTVEFPISQDGCTGQTLSQGQACNVGVLFAPTATGSHTASIKVTDNATGSPQLLPINGGGATKLTSSVTVAAAPTSAVFGSLFTLTAAVQDQNGKPVTNGSVTFLDGTTVLGTVQVVTNASGGQTIGTATLKTILIPLGANSITAKYIGADAPSTSAATVATVTGTYPTTTTFAAGGTTVNAQQETVYSYLTATVNGFGPVAPTGNLTITDGTTGLVPGTTALSANTLAQTFVAEPEITNLTYPYKVALVDLNGDGIPDLVSGLENGMTVQIGNGDGTFKTPTTPFGTSQTFSFFAFGDFNGDGKLDIVAQGIYGIGVALGNGDGTFQGVSYIDGNNGVSVAVGDFNGDGKLDIALGINNYNVDILLGNGDGTFQQAESIPTGGYPTQMAVADLNGDGNPDIVVTSYYNSGLGVLLGNGNGTFQPVAFVQTSSYPSSLAVADLRGTGKLDLVVVDGYLSNVGVILGNGNGTFQPEQSVLSGAFNAVTVGDVNGDRKPDLLVADYGNNAADVLRGNGDGTFQNPVPFSTGTDPYYIALADLNHDGRLDFVSANQSGNSATVYLNHVTQTATLSNAVIPGTGTHPVSATYAGDTNFATSTSNAVQLTASLIPATMQFAAQPTATLPWAQQLSVSATLTGPYTWVPAPTGTVSYIIDGGTAQPATLSGGAVVIPIAQLSVGNHSIAISYGGDQYYQTLPAQTLAVTIVKANQTITFPQLPNVTYGAAPITLAATATSGLPVAFTVTSGPATITNGILTITGAGTVVLAANQSGNIDYNAAPAVAQSFTVSKAQLTVVVNSATMVYGGTLPTFTGTVTGAVNGDVLTATYSSTGTATSGAGSYPITAIITGTPVGNYAITNTPGTLTINKAPLTLTANNLTTTYGSGLPSFTYTTSGLVNGDTVNKAFTGQPLLTTTATQKSPVGTYTITIAPGTLLSANYNFQYVNGTLSVGTAVLTVTPTTLNSPYGAALPTLLYTLNGFVNGDNATTATSGSAVLTTTATTSSVVGQYAITATVGTLTSTNYTFQFINGSLFITPAPLTIKVNSVTRGYSVANPTFTGTVTGIVNGDALTITYSTTATQTSPAGTYPITATVAGAKASNYAPAISNGTLTINPATLIVTASKETSVYGSGLPTFAFTYSGFVNGDTAGTATTGLPSLRSTATAQSSVGTYPITVSAGSLLAPNYTLQFVNSTYTITQATLNVTANPQSIVYGSALPPYTYSLGGLVNNDTPATAVTGTPSLTSTAVNGSAAGKYVITAAAGTLASTNYKLVYVANYLTIAKAVLTLTADSYTNVYGSAIPTLGYTLKGFVNNDTQSTATTGAPKLFATVYSTSPVGTYAITPNIGTLTATNYSFLLVNGALNITPAKLTMTVNNASRTYGVANPTFTGAITGQVGTDTFTIAYSTTATPSSPAGLYTINATVGGAKATNYTVTVKPGNLVVSKAVLSIIATNTPSVYGSPIPSFAYTVIGLLNGDTVNNAFTGAPNLTTLAVPTTPVGAYQISAAVGTLVSTNYSFRFVPGTLTITKAPLTVTANNINGVYGSAIPNLTYTFSGFLNGDIASKAVTGLASVSTTATPKSPVGPYPISISVGKLSSGNYSFVFVGGTYTVNPAFLTVAATNLNSVYGSAPPPLTFAITGLVNGDTTAAYSGAPTISTTATASSPAGPYAITPALGTLTSTNYAFQFKTGTLTVAKAPLAVTANTMSNVYGTPLPTFGYTLVGLVNGDTPTTAITGTPKLATTALYNSPVGPYAISVNLASVTSANYSLSFVYGTLNITPAPLTITVKSATRAYATANPTFSGTITGLISGDFLTVTYSTTATTSSPAGQYPITAAVSGTKATNYNITNIPGTLTIAPAVLTVAANASTSVYGSALPTFGVTYSGFLNGDTANTALSGAPSLTTTATAASPAGGYPITPSVGTLTAASYTFKFVPNTLLITKALLTISANPQVSIYGSALPKLTYTFNGLVNGDTAAKAVTGAPTISTTATAKSSVGSYPITIANGNLGASSYTFAFTPSNLTINPATLTVTATSFTIAVGSPIPTLTYGFSGFVNSDTQNTAVTGAAVLSTTATTTSPAGTYPITLTNGTLSATNYVFVDVNGVLTLK
jgi:hypothetical protein